MGEIQGLVRCISVRGRTAPLTDDHVPGTFGAKWDFAEAIKVVEMGKLSWFVHMGPNRITELLIRGRWRRGDVHNKGHKEDRTGAQECRQSLQPAKDPKTNCSPM